MNSRHQPWQGCTLPTELLPPRWCITYSPRHEARCQARSVAHAISVQSAVEAALTLRASADPSLDQVSKKLFFRSPQIVKILPRRRFPLLNPPPIFMIHRHLLRFPQRPVRESRGYLLEMPPAPLLLIPLTSISAISSAHKLRYSNQLQRLPRIHSSYWFYSY